MNVENARRMAGEKLEQLATELEAGQSATLKTYLAAMAKVPRYSVNNLLLILAQRPDARQIAGFNTWRRLGRSVRKGEHGIAILAPVVRRRRPDAVAVNAERKPLAAQDSDEAVVGFRSAYVFDVSQTDGAPLPEFACVAGAPGPFTDRLKTFIAKNGIQLGYSQSIAPARGVSAGGKIVLLPDLPPAEHLSTLAHELAHELMHSREGREPVSKPVRETEAEAVAYVVCQAIGLDTNTAAADYVALHQGDAKTLAASLERIQRTAVEIITAIGTDM
jgi:antirestriction protein ArdC